MSPEQQLHVLKIMITNYVIAVIREDDAAARVGFRDLAGAAQAIIQDAQLELAAREADSIIAKTKEDIT